MTLTQVLLSQAYKPNYLKCFTAFIILSCSVFTVQAQNHSYLKEVVVNPPNAASLAKYGWETDGR